MHFVRTPGLQVEEVSDGYLVLMSDRSEVLHLTGDEVDAFDLAGSGCDDVPEQLATSMAALVQLGLVTTDSWSRRKVLQLGGAAAAASVAIIALPSVAAAASGPGGGGGTTTLPTGPQQLLVNPSFDDGTTGWTAPDGFQTFNGNTGRRPAISGGQLHLATGTSGGPSGALTGENDVSQMVSVPPLGAYSQIVAETQVVKGPGPSTFAFKVTFYSNGTNLGFIRTPGSGTTTAPATPTIETLTLLAADFAGFSTITDVEVMVTGTDGLYWGGNYGPIFDYITLTVG